MSTYPYLERDFHPRDEHADWIKHDDKSLRTLTFHSPWFHNLSNRPIHLMQYPDLMPEVKVSRYNIIFPDNVKRFITENLDDSAFSIIDATVTKIKEMMNEKNLDCEVALNVSTDSEYTDWQELELFVKVNRDMRFIYENVKPAVYDILFELPQSVSDKILITFASK